MNLTVPHLNLVFAWAWFLGGFVTGMLLGMKFHQPDWLGGYASHARRMYRLGHISFFGLGTINLLFYFTVNTGMEVDAWLKTASIAFVIGGLTMPICCAIMARSSKWQMIFAIPVLSLIAGTLITIKELVI